MIKISPENLNFQINTTGVDLCYSEIEGLSIRLTIIKNEKTATATISFPVVAEFECIGMNFYEAQYENIAIEIPTGTVQDSAFYKNTDISSYEHKIKIYDPRNRFGLAEYYIPGNDSYLRIIASKYQVHINDSQKGLQTFLRVLSANNSRFTQPVSNTDFSTKGAALQPDFVASTPSGKHVLQPKPLPPTKL